MSVQDEPDTATNQTRTKPPSAGATLPEIRRQEGDVLVWIPLRPFVRLS